MVGDSFPYCNHLSWIRMMFTLPSSPSAPERLQEEQRMMLHMMHMGESLTFKDYKLGKTTQSLLYIGVFVGLFDL